MCQSAELIEVSASTNAAYKVMMSICKILSNILQMLDILVLKNQTRNNLNYITLSFVNFPPGEIFLIPTHKGV